MYWRQCPPTGAGRQAYRELYRAASSSMCLPRIQVSTGTNFSLSSEGKEGGKLIHLINASKVRVQRGLREEMGAFR